MTSADPDPSSQDALRLRESLRLRGAILVTLIGIFFFALFIPINLFRGLETIAWANAAAIVALSINLLLLFRHRNLQVTAGVAVGLIMAWFLVSASTGGVEIFFWVYSLPWVLFFFFGLRGGLVWSLVLAGYITALLRFLPVETRHGMVPLTILFSFLAVCGLAAIYEYLTHIYRQRIEEVSHRDSLTGTWNRRKFSEVAHVELARAHRYGRPLSLLMLDLDHFKAINDAYGHQVGDEMLQALARRVQGELRRSDFLFRWGGDEFVILATETGLNDPPGPHAQHDAAEAQGKSGEENAARALARKVRDAASLVGPGGEVVSVSIGVAELLPGDSEDSLVRRADEALYAAKEEGRDRVASVPRVPGLEEVEA
jgi:GGDEF domain-containing protein